MILRHPVFQISLAGALSFLLGFSYRYQLPRLETLLLTQIESQSAKRSPVRVWAKRLHLQLIPLGVVLEDVRVLPQAPLDQILAPTTLKEVGARLAIWPLFRGELRLSRVSLADSTINVFLRRELFKKSPTKKPARVDFEALYRLPVDELVLDDVRVQGRIEPQNVVFRLDDINLTLENRYRSLFVDLAVPSIGVKPSGRHPPLTAALEVRALIEARELQISALKLKADESFVVASGHFNGDLSAGQFENGTLEARARARLGDLNSWERVFFDAPRIPALRGRLDGDVAFELRQGQPRKIDARIATRDLKVDKFEIGELKTSATGTPETLFLDRLTVKNDSGQIDVRQIKLGLKPTPTLSAHVKIDNEVRSFLEKLGVNHVPIQIPLRAEATCEAEWGEVKRAKCRAKMEAPRVWVYNDKDQSTIVDVHDLRAEGETTVTPRDVTYSANLQVGKNSKGTSSGTINFEDGFKIFYEGERVDFADVQNLANLKIAGVVKLKGSTTGTSKWATLELGADARDFWLEDYPFGRFTGNTTYRAGQLGFERVQGQFGSSQYSGQVGLDLRAKQIKINAQVPFADLHDVQQIFGRKVAWPLEFTGTGQGSLEARGPFRVRDMTYKLRSSFYRGEIAHEAYDELVLNVSAKNGLVQGDRLKLVKSSGGAEAKGSITPEGKINLAVSARGLRLEQSENINRLGLDLQGLADVAVLVRGELPRPQIELSGHLTKVVLADTPAQDSTFRMNFLGDRVEGSGQFLGTTLVTDAVLPYSDEAPFSLKVRAQNWDFSSAFQFISKSARQLDVSSSLSGTINLQAPRGGFWNSSGQVSLNEVFLRKGAKTLSAPKPMLLNMRAGEVNSSDFGLSSGDNFVKLDVVGLRREHLDASLNGKLDISLLGLFTPFLSDLRGNAAISLDMKGTVEHPHFAGSAYVDKGYVKLNEFPHPFSNVRADLQFENRELVINSLESDVAGGKLSGDGRLTLSGPSHPVDVKGTFADVRINVPENFRTQGSGTVSVTGTGFPYLMSITYGVTAGDVIYEFGESSGGTKTVKPSAYLPQFLAQDVFHPFTLNVDVNLKNPVGINNSMVLAQVNGHLTASGTPDRLLLNGTLTPQPGGKVFFKDQAFEIASAYVDYTNNPPAEPKIFLNANTRFVEYAQNDTGRQASALERSYDINLLVQGRGPTPQIILSSQPALPQNDIVSLLALGITTGGGMVEKSGTPDGQSTANSSAAIGATLLQKAGAKQLKQTLGVDVKVSSSQATPDLASYPKVTLSKQWTPNFGASASSTLQATPTNDVKLEYKFNKNVSAVGSWTGHEHDYMQEQSDTAIQSVFGLDLEYKMQFK